MTLKKALANRINELCDNKELNPNSLAILCGMERSTVYSILGEKSKSPEVASIKKICDGLDITLGQFFSTPEFDNLDPEIM
jgi:transcriptional regulator with XRE-family HTH domain